MKQGSLLPSMEADTDWRPEAPTPIPDSVKEITLDVESTGLKYWAGDLPIGIGYGYKVADGQYFTKYMPFGHRGGGNLPEPQVKAWAKQELRGLKIKNLNSRFDNHMMYAWGTDLEEQDCVWGDVGHYAALLDDQRRRGFSLQALSKDFLGEGKVEGLDISNIADYHAGHVRAYAEQDVRLPLMLMDKMRPMLHSMDLMTVADLEDQVIYPVCEMERNGSPIDVEKLDRWIAETTADFTDCLLRIRKATGLDIDPGKRDDMVRLFRQRGLEIKKWTAGGVYRDPQPSFTDEVLAAINDPVIADVRRARRITSLRSKYLLNYKGELLDGDILRYALHQLKADEGGTVSGRFSSSAIMRGVGVNIQQVMRIDRHKETFGDQWIIRELFVPRDRYWLSADAKQIEFRGFVHYSDSERLIQRYRDDPDVDFHNIVWEIVKQFQPEFTRKTTKDINFAEIYGAGVYKTGKMLKTSRKKAEEFVEIYNEQFPEVKALLHRASHTAEERGYVMTILGRRFHFPGGQFLHKALSRIIQGSAADIMKRKAVELHKARKQTGFKMRFLVHDEVNGDIPDQESAAKVSQILDQQTTKFRVPILWDMKIGANWKECK